MIPTADPYVSIEEQRAGYVRYRNTQGRRWEVIGTCIATSRGPCMDIDVGPPEDRLDIPVLPGFKCSLCVDGGHLVARDL